MGTTVEPGTFLVRANALLRVVNLDRKQKPPPPESCLDLLTELHEALQHASEDDVKAKQRECEEALVALLLQGVKPPLRRLACACLCDMQERGDPFSIFARLNTVLGFLDEPDCRKSHPSSRLGALQCIASLAQARGASIAPQLVDAVGLAKKQWKAASAAADAPVRAAALQLVAAVLIGTNGSLPQSVPKDALKAHASTLGVGTAVMIAQMAKGAAADKAESVCQAGAAVLEALGRTSGAFLWGGGGGEFETAAALALKGMEDANVPVRDGYAAALGALACSAVTSEARQALGAIKAEKKRQATAKLMEGVVTKCLIVPLTNFSSGADSGKPAARSVRAALAGAWVTFLDSCKERGALTDTELVAFAAQALSTTVRALALCEMGRGVESVAALPAQSAIAERLKPRKQCATADRGLSSGAHNLEGTLHARAVVLFAVRKALVDRLGEDGQRQLLQALVDVVGKAQGSKDMSREKAGGGSSAMVVVGVVRVITYLLGALGEVPNSMRNVLEGLLLQLLMAPSRATQMEASRCIRVLAVTDASAPVRLSSRALAAMEDAQSKIVAAQEAPARSGPAVAVARDHVAQLRGHAMALSFFLAGERLLPLGLPRAVHTRAVDTMRSLLTHAAVEGREAGWMLAGALVQVAPELVVARHAQLSGSKVRKEAPRVDLVPLWAAAFDSVALQRELAAARTPAEAAYALHWRSVALEALSAYAQGGAELGHAREQVCMRTGCGEGRARLGSPAPPPPAPSGRSEAAPPVQHKAAMALVKQVLKAAMDLHGTPALEAAGSGGSAVAGALDLFLLRALQCVQWLPDPRALGSLHSTLIKRCSSTLMAELAGTRALAAEASTGGSGLRPAAKFGAALGPFCSCPGGLVGALLRVRLDPADTLVGPYVPGRDIQEEGVRWFCGAPDAPRLCVPAWGFAGPGEGVEGSLPDVYPMGQSLELELETAKLDVLERLMPVVVEVSRQQLLQGVQKGEMRLAGRAQVLGRKDVRRGTAARRPKLLAYVAVATLAAFKGIRPVPNHKDLDTPKRLLEICQILRTDPEAGAAHWRAAAELTAVAARLGGDAFARQTLHALCIELSGAESAAARAAASLAVGAVLRAVGGMALSAGVPEAASVLVAAACNPTGGAHVWALHALWLVADAAGAAFLRHAATALDLTLNLLLSDDAAAPGLPQAAPASIGAWPYCSQAAARVVNAVTAALGPELVPGDRLFMRCQVLIRELQHGAGRAEGFVAAASEAAASGTVWVGAADAGARVEAVRWTQELVVFAPHLLPTRAHAASLRATIAARQPALRGAAATALRVLAQREPQALEAAQVEVELFMALDRETDPRTAQEVCRTLLIMLHTCCPKSPSHWLQLCTAIALALPMNLHAYAEETTRQGVEGGDEGEEEDVDGDGDDDAGARRRRGAAAAAATTGSGAPPPAPRWRTRVFAAACLAAIPLALETSPPRGDGSSGGCLATLPHLQALMDAGYKVATGTTETLRPFGLQLLTRMVELFGAVEDTEYEGHLLLEQYQAQLLSALRCAFEEGAPPPQTAAGASLAAAVVERGLAGGDRGVLTRVLSLLAAPVQAWDQPRYQDYSEWVGVQVRIALLEAHARVAGGFELPGAEGQQGERCTGTRASVRQRERTAVVALQAPYAAALLQHWVALLRDHAVLNTQPPSVQALYTPSLVPHMGAAVLDAARPHYRAAWPAVLEAVAAAAVGADCAPALAVDEYHSVLGWALLTLQPAYTAGQRAGAGATLAGMPPVGRRTARPAAGAGLACWGVGAGWGLPQAAADAAAGDDHGEGEDEAPQAATAAAASRAAPAADTAAAMAAVDRRALRALTHLISPAFLSAPGYLTTALLGSVLEAVKEVAATRDDMPTLHACAALCAEAVAACSDSAFVDPASASYVPGVLAALGSMCTCRCLALADAVEGAGPAASTTMLRALAALHSLVGRLPATGPPAALTVIAAPLLELVLLLLHAGPVAVVPPARAAASALLEALAGSLAPPATLERAVEPQQAYMQALGALTVLSATAASLADLLRAHHGGGETAAVALPALLSGTHAVCAAIMQVSSSSPLARMNEAEPTDADLWEAATTTGHASLGVCLETLNASFAQGVEGPAVSAGMGSLCAAMEAGVRQQEKEGKYLWACRCLAEVVPNAVTYAKALLIACAQRGAGPLSPAATSDVGSVLKLLMLALTLTRDDAPTQSLVLTALLGVVMLAAAPTAPTPALRAAAAPLLTKLATAHPVPFRAVVEQMSPTEKQLLQACLQAASAPVPAPGALGTGAGTSAMGGLQPPPAKGLLRPPTIPLRTL